MPRLLIITVKILVLQHMNDMIGYSPLTSPLLYELVGGRRQVIPLRGPLVVLFQRIPLIRPVQQELNGSKTQ